jgi:hypothetical protein
MSELNKKFSIDDISLYRDDDDMDFAEVEIWSLADGENSHHNPFSREVLEKDADTFKGKFIVAKYDKYSDDVTTHVPDEAIIGYIDPREDIQFKDKEVNGETREFVVVKGLLSKIYATDVVEMFRKNNDRTVSCEFSCMTEHEEDNDGNPMDEFGNKMFGQDNPVLSYHIHGITVLGLNYKPSVPQTEIKVKKFAEKIDNDSLKRFAEERKEKLTKTYKVDKTEIKDTAWGNVDKTSMRNKIMKSKNRGSLVKDVYAQVLNGWEDSPSEDLKYPLMQLVGDTFYYNRGALSSALAYAKQHNDSDVVSKVEKLYKKFKLDEPNKEDNMADTQKKPTDDNKKEDDIIMDKDKKEMSDHEQNPEDAKKMGCGDGEKEMAKEDEKDTEVKDKEEDKEDKEEPKKFSLDAYADVPAIMAQLEHETDANKELAKKIMAMDAQGIVDTVMSFAKENDDLKKFKAEKEEEEKQKKLSQIMAAVKGDIDPKKFSELQEEGSKLSVNELNGFENKVKAFAYESSKGKNHVDDEFMRFASNDNSDNQSELTADEIYKKYL